MCPICLTTAAMIAASIASAGGLAAIVVRKYSTRNIADNNPEQTQSWEDHHNG
jgi:hypothetical protein